MIKLYQKHYKKILEHARQALPNEACGLLGGRIVKTGELKVKTVEEVYLLTNTDHSPEHFTMDPKEQFNAIKEMRKNNWQLLGNFHSHPETPSRPSEEDRKLAFDPETSYLILSLADRQHPVLKSFRINKNDVQEEEVVIKEE